MNKVFKIPKELQNLLLRYYLDGDDLIIELSDKYQNKQIKTHFDLTDIQGTLSNLEQAVKNNVEISNRDYNQIELFIQDIIKSTEITGKDQAKTTKQKKEVVVNKYSQNRRGSLFEAVLVNGEPYFVTLEDSNQNFKLKLVSSIEEPSRILIPPVIDEYLSEAYEFQSQEEFDSYIEKAKKENNTSLFKWAKTIVSKYVDQESHIVNLTALYINSSYFQDRFSTIPYMGIFGGNGNGKSSIGDTYEALGYRVYNTTDPTPANIFRSLGNVEPGQITLVLDESERIDQNPDMMSILKTGYDIRKTVSRVNQFTGKPEKFNTYCQKVIIGERSPSPVLARGVNDRILGDIAYYGNPQYDIKEVLNPTNTGGEKLKQLLSEITEFRKTMLVYRLLHFRDIIPDIQVKVTGRDKELIKPCLQLFSKFRTEEEKRIYEEEIKDTFTKFLEIKNEKKHSTIEYALIPLVLILMEESKIRSPIKFSDLWDLLQYHVKGELNKNKPNEYNTEDYGTIYRNTISSTLEKLGVKTKRQNTFVKLIFEKKKIKKTASQYGFIIQEKIDDENGERSECSECSMESDDEKNESGMETTIIKHSQNHNKPPERGLKNGQNDENSNIPDSSNIEKSNGLDNGVHSVHSIHPSDNDLKPNLYRIGKTDTIGCRDCKIKGDKWFMDKHPCSRSLSKK
jgi:hypothetical protein